MINKFLFSKNLKKTKVPATMPPNILEAARAAAKLASTGFTQPPGNSMQTTSDSYIARTGNPTLLKNIYMAQRNAQINKKRSRAKAKQYVQKRRLEMLFKPYLTPVVPSTHSHSLNKTKPASRKR